ncbi:integrase catalytic domain-containing protein [Propionivibrio sp.]|uniref:integrase catalytic domain-containing protein n=1 Tax=Propionivibrio sp. TaxID=2212460 RepID=UPI003BEFE9C6
MKAPLPEAATSVTLAEIAEALGAHRTSVLRRAEKEAWPFIAIAGRGGNNRRYPLSTLPSSVAKTVVDFTAFKNAITNPSAAHQAMSHCLATLARLDEEEAQAEQSRAERGEAQLRMLAGGLSDHEALSLKAHCEIAQGWRFWFVKQTPMKKSNSWVPFAGAYNLAEIPVSKAVRDAFPAVSPRSVQRWVSQYEGGNYEALVDRRNGSDKKGKSLFNAVPLLAAYAKKMMLERPGIRTEQLCKLLGTSSLCAVTGEALFTAPSYHQTMRFQRAWQEENHDLYLQLTNPDAFKNSSMLAFGSYSADVTRLNQRWEMDATPADWLLIDEDGKKRRYTVSVIVDIWSRRVIVVVAKTPKTQTHCTALRLALLAWGVPEEIVTDNGADYLSEHFERVLKALEIAHLVRNPFSPEEKPHVERFNRTMNHSILELLLNFAGHSVADRKAINARQSFAERLAKKGELVDFADVVDGSCSGETLQKQINTWLAGVYEQREHGGLENMTPFAKAASFTGEGRTIRDERSLDILLSRPASRNGTATLQKKGIRLDNTWFIAPELASIEMGSVLELFETPDLGVIVVYYRKNFLCLAQDPARTGASRIEIAKQADVMQKERLKTARANFKAETRGVPDTGAVLQRYLEESAAAAGKLVQAQFGKTATEHTSHGLEQAAKAAKALAGPKVSAQAAALSERARQAMAEAPTNLLAHPAAGAYATPLEGMTPTERYVLHGQYVELVAAHGGDVEVLTEAWQRRFLVGFPKSSIYRAQAALANAQKETATR